LQRRRNLGIAPGFTTLRGICFQWDAGLQQAMLPVMGQGDEPSRSSSLSVTMYFFTALFLLIMRPRRRW
jgi:hypothetical protein